MRARLADASAASSPLRQPGNLPAWVEGDDLCLRNQDGSVTRERMPRSDTPLVPAGHGFVRGVRDKRVRHYDLTLRRHVELPAEPFGHVAVRGLWLLRPQKGEQPTWRRFDPQTSDTTAIAALPAGSGCLGLLDDDAALFSIPTRSGHDRVAAYCPAPDKLVEVTLPEHPFLASTGRIFASSRQSSVFGQRDPYGRMIVSLHRGRPGNLLVAIDPRTRACAVVLATELLTDILVFEPSGSLVCCEDYNRLVRYTAGGVRSVIYPVATPWPYRFSVARATW